MRDNFGSDIRGNTDSARAARLAPAAAAPRNRGRPAACGRNRVLLGLQLLTLALAVLLLARPGWRLARSSVGWLRARAVILAVDHNRPDTAARLWSWPGLHYTPDAKGECHWLAIPAVNLAAPVSPDPSEKALAESPVFAVRETPGGLTVISAHRDKHFRELENLKVGDRVDLRTFSLPSPALPSPAPALDGVDEDAARATSTSAETNLQSFVIREIEILSPRIAAARIAESHGQHKLILMTCHPFRYIGPAPDRFIAWANPVPPGQEPAHVEEHLHAADSSSQ